MNISFHYLDKVSFRIDINDLYKRFFQIAFFENVQLQEVNVIFVNDRRIKILNKKYLNHNYPTDIITFNYSESLFISGDLFISIDTIWYNSKMNKVSFKDELYRVIIHGILHLIKYNDKSKVEKIIMRKKENYYLRLFR